MSPDDRAAAEAAERYAIRLDAQTLGWAFVFALAPLVIVTVFLMALLGEWAWILGIAGFLAMMAGLRMIPLRQRYLSELPLELPNAVRLHGQRKRRFIVRVAVIACALFVGEMLFRMYGGKLWVERWLGRSEAEMGILSPECLAPMLAKQPPSAQPAAKSRRAKVAAE